MEKAEQFAKVLVDAPGLPPLDYRVPEDMLAAAGDLVLVPLGPRKVIGVIAELAASTGIEGRRLRSLSSVLRVSRPLSAEWLALTRFASV